MNQRQRSGIDLLVDMIATAEMSHLEMSALNAPALENTVGAGHCRVFERSQNGGREKEEKKQWRVRTE